MFVPKPTHGSRVVSSNALPVRLRLVGAVCTLTLLASIGLLHSATANARGVRQYVVQEGDVTPDPVEIETPAEVLMPTSTPAGQPTTTTTDTPTAEPTVMPTRTAPTDTPLPPTSTRAPDPTATPLPPTVSQPTATLVSPKPDPTYAAGPAPASPTIALSPVETPSPVPDLTGVADPATTPRSAPPTTTRLPLTTMPTPGIKPSYTPFDDDALVPFTPQPVNVGSLHAVRTAPVGAVYTTRQMRMSDGRYTVAVCIANIGAGSVAEVSVTFVLSQPDAAIVSLWAPSAPSEISNNQARAIIRDVPPGRQVQIDVVIYAKDSLDDGQPIVTVPEAYRLTSADPMLVCSPRDAALDPAESVEAQFVIGGEAVEADRAVDALSARLGALSAEMAGQEFRTKPAEVVLSTTTLRMLLVTSGVLLLILVGLFFFRWRQRSTGS